MFQVEKKDDLSITTLLFIRNLQLVILHQSIAKTHTFFNIESSIYFNTYNSELKKKNNF